MARIDMHGLKMQNLNMAAKNTTNLDPFSGRYYEILYNRETGFIDVAEHVSYGSYTEILDKEIIFVCSTTEHLTMQALADKIYASVKRAEKREAYNANRREGDYDFDYLY